MREGLFRLQESVNDEVDTQGKNCKFLSYRIMKTIDEYDSGDNKTTRLEPVNIDYMDVFGTKNLMLDPIQRVIQVITKNRYADPARGGFDIGSTKLIEKIENLLIENENSTKTINARHNGKANALDSLFNTIVPYVIVDVDAIPCYRLLGLKLAGFNDRHTVFLLQKCIGFDENNEPKWDRFMTRFEAKLGTPARGLTEEKQAARWINEYLADRLTEYPSDLAVNGLFNPTDSLGNVRVFGVSTNQELSFDRWFKSVLKGNSKNYRCFMRKDLLAFLRLFSSKAKNRAIDVFTQADFFILSDTLISELRNSFDEDYITVSALNNWIQKEDLFPISFKSSTKLTFINFISDGHAEIKNTRGVIDIWREKLSRLKNPNIHTYAKLWVSGVSLFKDGTYTINVTINVYDSSYDVFDPDKKHFLVGVQFRSAGKSKCIAETQLRAYSQSIDTSELIEVTSAGQGGKITSQLPKEALDVGKQLVEEYFNSKNGWYTDFMYKTGGRIKNDRDVNLNSIGFIETNLKPLSFDSQNNKSVDKVYGVLGYLRGDKTEVYDLQDIHGRSDFFIEIDPIKTLKLLKVIYRIHDVDTNEDDNDNDYSLNYYKWENRHRDQIPLNERIKIAEARVRIAERNLKQLLESR